MTRCSATFGKERKDLETAGNPGDVSGVRRRRKLPREPESQKESESEREREREKQQHPVLTYCMGLFLNIGIRGGLILSLVAVPISLCVCRCMCNEELE